MTLHTFKRAQVGKKYHVEWPTLKHVENSVRGVKYAKRHGYKTIDLDMLPDEELVENPKLIAGHIWNTHWPDPFRRDGFRDPKRILGKGDKMHEMNAIEISRLVAGHRPKLYHIPHIESQLHLCAEIGLQALIEPKRSTVWLRQPVWDYLADVCEKNGTHVAVYSEYHDCLPMARKAGFNAWPI